MSSSNTGSMLSPADRQALLQLAETSIKTGLGGDRLRIDPAEYSPSLQQPGASFVTIKVRHELRGCIGTLECERVLAIDVVQNAYAAAFRDPRFSPLTAPEFEHLHVHVSVLGRPESIEFASERDLIQQLRPGVDGVILQEGSYRATFLPAVWESLPDPNEFMQQLKCKAGLSADHWSDKITVQRYTTESIP
ncbi:MAG: AmmeMemoRadiSam system protein A [Acidiferrobacterales bacterium]